MTTWGGVVKAVKSWPGALIISTTTVAGVQRENYQMDREKLEPRGEPAISTRDLVLTFPGFLKVASDTSVPIYKEKARKQREEGA